LPHQIDDSQLRHAQKRLQAVDAESDQAEANMAEALESAADWHTAYQHPAVVYSQARLTG